MVKPPKIGTTNITLLSNDNSIVMKYFVKIIVIMTDNKVMLFVNNMKINKNLIIL